jgi:hypothetical protein
MSGCSATGVRTDVSEEDADDAPLASAPRWLASAGAITTAPDPGDPSREVMQWSYPLSGDAIFAFTRSGLTRFRGAKGVRLRVRSDRAGEFAIRMDYTKGDAFWTKFEVGTSWTEVLLSPSEIRHVAGKDELELGKIAMLFLVDLSG